jgi:FKBP-type peptidyl-prolyl cis-trans isomerase
MLERTMLAAGLAIALLACNKQPAEEKKPDTAQAADKAKTDDKPKDEGLPAPPDVAAPPADAQKTPSGLASKVIKPGTGTEHPNAWDKVTVHYTGWTTDGKMFDSSVKPRFPGLKTEPATFPLNRVIPGWTEGVQLMVTGEQRRFWIPENIAYKGQPGAPAGMLVFDVELISIEKMPPPPETPADVAAPPADAQKGFEGLMSKVLTKGTGKVKPKETDFVKVHYTGWTTDGNMFDSSVTRGEPATFPLDKVIKGWTKGVSQMVVGEKRRLWIPKELAYNDKPGKPQGMLVFDVELLDILSVDAPKDVKAAPGNAEKTQSGLASRVLTKGTGTEHPSATSTVKVHYTGWTTDGKMFDSSVTRGEPAEFPLNGVIAGWTEGVQLMTVGEKRRFWIPEELAYKGQPGAPAGMLVFDVELLEIKK